LDISDQWRANFRFLCDLEKPELESYIMDFSRFKPLCAENDTLQIRMFEENQGNLKDAARLEILFSITPGAIKCKSDLRELHKIWYIKLIYLLYMPYPKGIANLLKVL